MISNDDCVYTQIICFMILYFKNKKKEANLPIYKTRMQLPFPYFNLYFENDFMSSPKSNTLVWPFKLD